MAPVPAPDPISFGGAGARIKEPPVLVGVGEHDRRIVLEGVEHAVAVVRVDVDVGDAHEAVLALEVLDHDADVVEYAEARGMGAPGMVQSRDRHEAASRLPGHDRLHGDQRGADDVARGLEDALERGRVAAVEQSLAGRRARDDELHVARIVEQLELGARRPAGRESKHAPVVALGDELAPERVVTVRPERVAVRKAVAGDALAGDDAGVRSAVFSHAMPPVGEGVEAA